MKRKPPERKRANIDLQPLYSEGREEEEMPDSSGACDVTVSDGSHYRYPDNYAGWEHHPRTRRIELHGALVPGGPVQRSASASLGPSLA